MDYLQCGREEGRGGEGEGAKEVGGGRGTTWRPSQSPLTCANLTSTKPEAGRGPMAASNLAEGLHPPETPPLCGMPLTDSSMANHCEGCWALSLLGAERELSRSEPGAGV